MNAIVRPQTLPTASFLRSTTAAAMVAATFAPWPTKLPLDHGHRIGLATSGNIERAAYRGEWSFSAFEQQIGSVYQELLARQEPLGDDFEAVWDANVSDLYES